MRKSIYKRFTGLALAVILFWPGPGAAAASLDELPTSPGLVAVSGAGDLPLLKGITVNPRNPFKVRFIIDAAGRPPDRKETARLVEYFLAALALPQERLWVNLSPVKSERIIDDDLARTRMGEDMLKEDYWLKRVAASLTYPESKTGADYWQAIYSENSATAYDPVKSACRVWIVPGDTLVYEQGLSAVIKRAPLRVLSDAKYRKVDGTPSDMALERGVIPALDKLVNSGREFARIRQIYHAFVLAHWFKTRLRESVFAYYFNQARLKGIDRADSAAKEEVYRLYLAAFKKGAYDYVRKSAVGFRAIGSARKIVSRRYYCGGENINAASIDMRPAPDSASMVVPGGEGVPVEFTPDIDRQVGSLSAVYCFYGSAPLEFLEENVVRDVVGAYYMFDDLESSTPPRELDVDQPETGLIAEDGKDDYFTATGVFNGKRRMVKISIFKPLKYAPVPKGQLFMSFYNGRNPDIVMLRDNPIDNRAENGEDVSALRELVEFWFYWNCLYKDNLGKLSRERAENFPAARNSFQIINLMAMAQVVKKYGTIALTPMHRWFIEHVAPARARNIVQDIVDFYYGDRELIRKSLGKDFPVLDRYIARYFLPALRKRAALDPSLPGVPLGKGQETPDPGGVLITTQTIRVVGKPVKISVKQADIDCLRNSKGMGYRIGKIDQKTER